mgnify:CR=1 FL=1
MGHAQEQGAGAALDERDHEHLHDHDDGRVRGEDHSDTACRQPCVVQDEQAKPGLDAAVPAAFLGLVWPRLTGKTERFLAISAVALALIATPYVPAGVPIISTAALAVFFGLRGRVWR